MLTRIRVWLAAHPRCTLTLLVFAALGPFLAKPFNIDDPLFIWLAQHVQARPENPFGFNVNWYGLNSPMWTVTENPPLAGYYFALAGSLLGWSEIALHLAGLLAALAVVLGTYRLAVGFCRHPMFAACAVLFAPVFLVSANTVMCDMLMLALWVWAIVFWTEGLEQNQAVKIFAAGLLMGLALLTKYFGVALIPVLAVHGGMQKRQFGGWVTGLLIPLAMLGAYQWFTQLLYGHALFSDAAGFVSTARNKLGFSKSDAGLIALCFMGGGMAGVIFLAPWLWRVRSVAIVLGAAVLLGSAIYYIGFFYKYAALQGPARVAVGLQFALWLFGGLLVLLLSVDVLHCPRNSRAWLLTLWLAGTFLFTAFGNWTVNGRSILPMVPAVGILLARRYDLAHLKPPLAMKLSFAASAFFALVIAQSDLQLAVAVRRNAQEVMAKYGPGNGVVQFEGHWGFQYYMEKLGAKPLEYNNFKPVPGAIMIVPAHNTYIAELPSDIVAQRDILSVPGPFRLTTWHAALGAGFYSSVVGPLPFAFGAVPAESLLVYRLKVAGNN